ncbi:MAG: DUF308 domain-containing protein [Lachnospiraceae bacterium]|nr:DUF308 domain-containing protein [Lachnospiraceae bacterium]
MFGIGSKKRLEREIEQEQKIQKENQLKWYHYLLSALFILSGAVFIGYTGIDITFICRFLAVVFAAAGVISILMYCFKDVSSGYYRLELVYGVMSVFAAVIFLTKQDVIGIYFPVIAGCILFGNGVIKLQHSIDMKRIDRKMKKVTEMWLVVMIFALLCISAGAVAVYLTPTDDRKLFLFIGIAFVVAGITDVITHIVFNGKVRIFKSGNYLTEETEPETEKAEKTEDNEAETGSAYTEALQEEPEAYAAYTDPEDGSSQAGEEETAREEGVATAEDEDAADRKP